jgi:hypothetical protein
LAQAAWTWSYLTHNLPLSSSFRRYSMQSSTRYLAKLMKKSHDFAAFQDNKNAAGMVHRLFAGQHRY